MGFLDRLLNRGSAPPHSLDEMWQPLRVGLLSGNELSPIRSDSALGGVMRSSFSNNLYQALMQDATGYSDGMLSRAYLMSVTAWACINLKAGLLSAIPIHVIDREGDPLEEHPLVGFTEDSTLLLQNISMALDIWGRAYLIKRVNQHGFLSGLEFVSTPNVSYRTNPDRRGINRIVGYQLGNELIPPHMIIDIRLFDPVDQTGAVSPLETVITQIAIGRNIDIHTSNFFWNGATLSGILAYPEIANKEALKKIRQEWASMFKGARKAHKTWITGGLPKYEPMQAAPKDLDMTALSTSKASEVARAFNVDPVLIGLGKASDPLSAQGTYEAIERAQIRGKTVPRAEWILSEINRQWAWQDFVPVDHFTLAVNRTEIAALSNATMENATISTTLQTGGTITLDESRARMELPPLENDNGAVITISGVLYPADQLAEVARLNVENLGMAGAFGGFMPSFPAGPLNPISETPDTPAEGMPQNITATETLNGAQITAAIGVLDGVRANTTTPLVAEELLIALGISPERAARMVSDTLQNAAPPADALARSQLAELRNWRKLSDRPDPFKAVALRGHPVAQFVRTSLEAGTYPFDLAKRWLETGRAVPDDEIAGATPEQFEAYWKRFDALKVDVGKDWLEWMGRIWSKHKKALLDSPDKLDALAVDAELATAWIGTPDAPGPLTEIFAAGVAAGNDAINRERAADPSKPRAVAEISFDLTNEQAVEYAKAYMYKLIKGLNETTARKMQRVVAAWIESGEPLSELEKQLAPIFKDKPRARMIAQTESTRVFNEGAFTRYEEVGITKATWQTVRDGNVCSICRPLHNKVGEFRAGWVHPGGSGDSGKHGGSTFQPPAHPRCRCFTRPWFTLDELLGA